MALRIAIEGNISAGKSTLLSLLSKELDFLVVPEPLDKWQSIDNSVEEEGEETGIQSESQESGMNLLVCFCFNTIVLNCVTWNLNCAQDYFYHDPKRWGYTFQTYAFLSRIRAQLRPFEEFQQFSQMYNVKTSDGYRNKKQRLADSEGGSENTRNGHAFSRQEEKENDSAAIGSKRSRSHEPANACAQLNVIQSDSEVTTTFYIGAGTTPFGIDSKGNFTVDWDENSSLVEKYGELMANKESQLFVLRSSQVGCLLVWKCSKLPYLFSLAFVPLQSLSLNRLDTSGNKTKREITPGSIEPLSDGTEVLLGDHKVQFHLITETGSNIREDSARANVSYSNPQLKDKILLYERSVLSDRYCFAANCRRSSLFQEIEWRVYCDWHNFLLKAFDGLRLDGLVYLRTSPQTCLGRLQKRARSEESSVGIEYLTQLHRRHEDWLIERKVGKDHKLPILVVDADKEFETDPKRAEEILKKMRQFVEQIKSVRKRNAEKNAKLGTETSTSLKTYSA
eukprot:gb/GECG01015651.1/.p1 GENE.gb/GECG01015651.1/~~gb/GECG01015651.1/.p1  ORF type:complete len:508 (+),score=57.72 gb/GECG01015651.1/:1-1524(+)